MHKAGPAPRKGHGDIGGWIGGVWAECALNRVDKELGVKTVGYSRSLSGRNGPVLSSVISWEQPRESVALAV